MRGCGVVTDSTGVPLLFSACIAAGKRPGVASRYAVGLETFSPSLQVTDGWREPPAGDESL